MSLNNNIMTLNVRQKNNFSKFDEFNLNYWNINSLENKVYLIEIEINSTNGKDIHFIALTETRIFFMNVTFTTYQTIKPTSAVERMAMAVLCYMFMKNLIVISLHLRLNSKLGQT